MYRAKPVLRALAAAIDGVAAFFLFLCAAVGSSVGPSVQTLFLFLWIAYSSTEVLFSGTPGKLLLSLRIVRQDGSHAGFWMRLLRWSTKYYALHIAIIELFLHSTFLMYLAGTMNAFIVSGLLGVFNEDRLAFHDQWSGTAIWRLGRRVPPYVPGFDVSPIPQ